MPFTHGKVCGIFNKQRQGGKRMIRKAIMTDMPAVLCIFEAARVYMRETGNPTQWGMNNPSQETLEADIRRGELYVICGEDQVPHAAFALVAGEDPTYGVIEEGDWTSDESYMTIHRVGSDGTMKGVFSQCVEFCKQQSDNIRADTHENNKTMQHLLTKHGFVRCGIVHVADGTPRLAYQYLKEG